MRWNPNDADHGALTDLIHRADPKARIMADIIVTSAEDIQNTKGEFDAGTQSPSGNFETLAEGAVRLDPTDYSVLQHATSDGWLTDLDDESPMYVLEWAPPASLGPRARLSKFTARLTRKRDGGQATFDGHWGLQIYWVRAETIIGMDYVWDIVPLLDREVLVDAAQMGANEEDVAFDLTPYAVVLEPVKRKIALPPLIYPPGAGREILFRIRAIPTKADGEDATGTSNVGWATDSAIGASGKSVTEGWAYRRKLTATTEGYWIHDPEAGLPRAEVFRDQYPDPASYSDLTMDVDLGAAPTGDVELEFQHEEPAGTDSVAEISDDGGTGWDEFLDGDVVGKDNSGQGGKDLSGVSVQQTYKVRWRAKANTARDTSPILRRIGPRERTRYDVSALINVNAFSGWRVDPITLESTIGELKVDVIRDGLRDFEDLATRIVRESDFRDIELELFIGHPDLPRYQWGRVEVLRIDDRTPLATAESFTAVSVLEQLRGLIPPLDPNSTPPRRLPVVYDSETLKDVIEDIVDTQAALPHRYRGELLENATDKVKKRITENDALKEASALAYIDGKALIASRGRVKAVDLHGDTLTPVEAIERQEIQVLQIDPGFRHRQPEFFIRYGWDAEAREYAGEIRSFNDKALAALGRARVEDEPVRPAEEVEQWLEVDSYVSGLPKSSVAEKIAPRIPRFTGTGLILAPIQLARRRPWLEKGDRLAVEQDLFTGRDPITGREISGRNWLVGVIVEQYDVWGSQFLLWVRGYSDIISGAVSHKRWSWYPIIWIQEQSGENDLTNAIFKVHAWPDAADIYYIYQAYSAAIPERTLDGTGWTQVIDSDSDGQLDPITVARDASDDKRLSIYGVYNGQMSPVQTVVVGPNISAEILDSSVSESGDGGSGTACVKRTVDVDAHTKKVRVYRRLDNWPTTDDLQTGPLDETYYKGELDAARGYVFEDCHYSTDDVVHDIWVPLDRNGNPGPREEFDPHTVTGSATPRFLTCERSIGTDGSACSPESSQRSCVISWTTDGVGVGTHTVVIYYWWGFWWEWEAEVDALSGSPKTIYFNTYKGTAEDPVRDQDVKVILRPTSGPDDDIRILPENRSPFRAKTCGAWPD